jgi:hypothetical protein
MWVCNLVNLYVTREKPLHLSLFNMHRVHETSARAHYIPALHAALPIKWLYEAFKLAQVSWQEPQGPESWSNPVN